MISLIFWLENVVCLIFVEGQAWEIKTYLQLPVTLQLAAVRGNCTMAAKKKSRIFTCKLFHAIWRLFIMDIHIGIRDILIILKMEETWRVQCWHSNSIKWHQKLICFFFFVVLCWLIMMEAMFNISLKTKCCALMWS